MARDVKIWGWGWGIGQSRKETRLVALFLHLLCAWLSQSPAASAPALNCTPGGDPSCPGDRCLGSGEADPGLIGSITSLRPVPSDLRSDSSTVSGPLSGLARSPQHRGEGGCALGGSGMKWVCLAFATCPTSLLIGTASLGERVGIWSTQPSHGVTGSHLPREVGMEGYLQRLTQTRRISCGSNLQPPRQLSSSTDAAFS